VRGDLPGWRGLGRGRLAALTGTGLTLLLLAARWPESPLVPAGVLAAFAALAGAAAHLLDEPAAEVVRATPFPAVRRYGQRLLAGLAPLAAGLLGLAVLVGRRPSLSWAGSALVLAGLLLATVGVCAAALGHSPAPGERVAEAVAPLVLAMGLLGPTARWVDVFPVADAARWGRTLTLWAAMALLGAVALLRTVRHPAR
jgi:hypothetical protein